jgi:O-acetyl-ADP-ribose deacetylase (regulator of RNase III)
MKELIGDIIEMGLEQKIELLIHGCNCFHTMGAGIAVGVRKTFPEAYEADLKTPYGDKSKLGSYSKAVTKSGLIIINAYTQFTPSPAKTQQILSERYRAIESCLLGISEEFPDKKIGIPYIGAGLAGGDWNVIRPIIEETLDGTDTTIVQFWKDAI